MRQGFKLQSKQTAKTFNDLIRIYDFHTILESRIFFPE